jgi:hypothetical protein
MTLVGGQLGWTVGMDRAWARETNSLDRLYAKSLAVNEK